MRSRNRESLVFPKLPLAVESTRSLTTLERLCDDAMKHAHRQFSNHLKLLGSTKDGTHDLDRLARLENKYESMLGRIEKIEREEGVQSVLDREDRMDAFRLFVNEGRMRSLSELRQLRANKLDRVTDHSKKRGILVDEYDQLYQAAIMGSLIHQGRSEAQKQDLLDFYRGTLRKRRDMGGKYAALVSDVLRDAA